MMKNIMRLTTVLLILFASLSKVHAAYDSTLFFTAGDTVIIDMGIAGQPGEFSNNDTIYVYPTDGLWGMTLEIGPTENSNASYVMQRPDMNVNPSSEFLYNLPETGLYHVSESVSGKNYYASFTVLWADSMKQTPKLSGKDTICSNNKYYTLSIKPYNTTLKRYTWYVSPDSAGKIYDTGITATIIPNINYSGVMTIRVLADSTTPPLSNPVLLHITQSPMSIFDQSTGSSALDINFSNTSINATSYTWIFGDGMTSNDTSQTTFEHIYASANKYNVMLISKNSQCKDTLSKSITVGNVSITDHQQFLTLYPNPASDYIHIEGSFQGLSLPYTITNIEGIVMLSGVISSDVFTIDISLLPSGTYIIQIKDKSFKFIKKP